MPRIRFTENIQRHVACPERDVPGGTLREALDAYFEHNRQARSYILDEQGALRKHMAIFLDGRPVADRSGLTDPLPAGVTIDIVQALSGG